MGAMKQLAMEESEQNPAQGLYTQTLAMQQALEETSQYISYVEECIGRGQLPLRYQEWLEQIRF